MTVKGVKKPIVLVILDGWGIAPAWGGNAISQARTKYFDLLWQSYPSALLQASGSPVGLPSGAPGNSEAGHLNIGAGRKVNQDTVLIDEKINDDSFYRNTVLLDALSHAVKNNSKIHLMGLLSKTGVHSDINHLYSLLKFFKSKKFNRIYIHLFSDGRDSSPMSGIEMLDEVEQKIREIGVGTISSISGRFFSMDRDNRWGRVARAYNMLVKGEGNKYENARIAFSSAYASGLTDEFIDPRLIEDKTRSATTIADNDAIVLFNFRGDRARELTNAFLEDSIPEFPDRKKLNNIFFATFVIYQENSLAKQVFKPERIFNSLAKIWSDNGLSQFHIAETEKYAHITYFVNGGVETPFPEEYRMMIPSPRNFKTYDFCPEMSAGEVTQTLIETIKLNNHDCFMINYANADMVGHTGNLKAAIRAAEFVDNCLGKILSLVSNRDGVVFIVADHGNAEQMVNPHTGYPDTEHTTNPVPFIVFNNNQNEKNIRIASGGSLGSVAPTILEMMKLTKPESMSGKSLIIR